MKYNKAWQKEAMTYTKVMLIEILKNALIEIDRLKANDWKKPVKKGVK